MSRNTAQEEGAYKNHLAFSQTLLADQYKCTKFAEHSLINWFAGEPPRFPGNTGTPPAAIEAAPPTTTTTAAGSN